MFPKNRLYNEEFVFDQKRCSDILILDFPLFSQINPPTLNRINESYIKIVCVHLDKTNFIDFNLFVQNAITKLYFLRIH
jgi:hypothetical protein